MRGFNNRYWHLAMLKLFRIDLKNLSPATTYKFSYLLENDFFEQVDGPEVRKGKVNIALSVVRNLSSFEMNFQINGLVTVDCDRCLEDMEIPIESANRLVVTFGDTYAETSDEQVIVSEEEGFIHIAWYLYEFIALSIPMKHSHELGDCNEVMASKLKEHCVDELLEGDETNENSQTVDPRWDMLRNLMKEN